MRREPFRRLVFGPEPTPDRVFFHSFWFAEHNNPRYAELIPRLQRLDRYLVPIGRGRVRRGLEYRFHRASRHVRYAAVYRLASRRYRACFTTDNELIPSFTGGPVVSDVDDPTYTAREVALLNHPNLAAYVVTHERAAARFEELGVRKPWHVIPQGVSLSSIDSSRVRELRAGLRRPDEVAVGYMAAWLLTADDRGGDNPLYNVDHLLALWQDVHAQVPEARLWLIGGASGRVRELLAGRDDVLLLGRLPREQALAHVASLDIALYPRTQDQGVQAAKIAEYMGAGVPTVSYDFAVTADLRETGAGVLVSTPRQFAEAVVGLARNQEDRLRLAEAAWAAGRARDWDVLARRYAQEVLDRYLA